MSKCCKGSDVPVCDPLHLELGISRELIYDERTKEQEEAGLT